MRFIVSIFCTFLISNSLIANDYLDLIKLSVDFYCNKMIETSATQEVKDFCEQAKKFVITNAYKNNPILLKAHKSSLNKANQKLSLKKLDENCEIYAQYIRDAFDDKFTDEIMIFKQNQEQSAINLQEQYKNYTSINKNNIFIIYDLNDKYSEIYAQNLKKFLNNFNTEVILLSDNKTGSKIIFINKIFETDIVIIVNNQSLLKKDYAHEDSRYALEQANYSKNKKISLLIDKEESYELPDNMLDFTDSSLFENNSIKLLQLIFPHSILKTEQEIIIILESLENLLYLTNRMTKSVFPKTRKGLIKDKYKNDHTNTLNNLAMIDHNITQAYEYLRLEKNLDSLLVLKQCAKNLKDNKIEYKNSSLNNLLSDIYNVLMLNNIITSTQLDLSKINTSYDEPILLICHEPSYRYLLKLEKFKKLLADKNLSIVMYELNNLTINPNDFEYMIILATPALVSNQEIGKFLFSSKNTEKIVILWEGTKESSIPFSLQDRSFSSYADGEYVFMKELFLSLNKKNS